jgi:tetratricopeptide (TPR) repeat protein
MVGQKKKGVEPEIPVHRLVSRSESLSRLGMHAEARRFAELAIERDPEHLGAMEALAKALWHSRDFDSLTTLIDRLLAMNPYEPGYHALRGSVLYAKGQYAQSLESYERSLSLPGGEFIHDAPIRSLVEQQRALQAQLMQDDPVFRASFRRDPHAACKEQGLPAALLNPATNDLSVSTRPS